MTRVSQAVQFSTPKVRVYRYESSDRNCRWRSTSFHSSIDAVPAKTVAPPRVFRYWILSLVLDTRGDVLQRHLQHNGT